ncbi:MAG: helix-turn-helix transcriptional regulator [Candidatus Methanofastidiosia archaeon]
MQKRELKRAIVKILRNEKMHGYKIKRQLETENIKVSHNNLYKILREMEVERYIKSCWERSESGPKKRNYELAEKGRRELVLILGEAITIFFEFYSEYIMPHIFETLRFDMGKSIGYVSSRHFSSIDRTVVKNLCESFPDRTIYFIKPLSYDINFNSKNLIKLEGDLTNIPLKNDYLDFLSVLDISRTDNIETAIKEYKRVLRKEGQLLIVTPLTKRFLKSSYLAEFLQKAINELIKMGPVDIEDTKKLLEGHSFSVNVQEDRELVFFFARKI